tara:strand:- start:615 stop:920 length:306 start_codon:yes stop_codon:yes gene_type:complete
VNTQNQPTGLRKTITRELALFTGFLFFGLVVLPILIYQVGQSIFGTYGGAGFGDFFDALSGKIRNGDLAAWFLILSPYLGWQILRLFMLGWRAIGQKQQSA